MRAAELGAEFPEQFGTSKNHLLNILRKLHKL